jgi:hypothetical protein
MNAPFPIEVTESGIFILVSWLLANEKLPIVVTELGIIILVS